MPNSAVHWDQEPFHVFQNGLSPERRRQDQRELSEIFNRAAHVPSLARELEWAHAHGIGFFIDRTCKDVGGYYVNGRGIVALAWDSQLCPLQTLAHEIRHAWQDYNRLLPNASWQDFPAYYINTCLIEADASAAQELTRWEVERGDAASHPERVLWKGFRDWYYSWRPESYGDSKARWYAHDILGMDVKPREYNMEFSCPDAPMQGMLQVHQPQDVSRLGAGHGVANYFRAAADPNFVEKVLNPAKALRFFNVGRSQPEKLVVDICARQKCEHLCWIKPKH